MVIILNLSFKNLPSKRGSGSWSDHSPSYYPDSVSTGVLVPSCIIFATVYVFSDSSGYLE